MSYSTTDPSLSDTIIVIGDADRPDFTPLVSNIINELTSIDRFRKIESGGREIVDMRNPIFTTLSEVEIDANLPGKVIFGRIGNQTPEGRLLRESSYNAYFILSNTITQDLLTIRKSSKDRTKKSVDENVFDLTSLDRTNPFKQKSVLQILDEVHDNVVELSRDISAADNESDYIQNFKKDSNVSPEDYKKLKIRKDFSIELRGLNRKRTTGV